MIVVSDTSPIRPVLDELVNTAGFWVAAELRQRVLEAAGEA